MRDYSAAAKSALEDKATYKITPRLTCYKSRIYFSTYTDDAPDFALPVGDTGNPLAQAAAYNSTISKIVSVVVDESGQINLLVQGSSTPVVVTYSGNPLLTSSLSRPGIIGNSILYNLDDFSNWKKATFDAELLDTGEPACITSVADFSTEGKGSIYPVTENEAIILKIEEGMVRPVFVDSDGVSHAAPGRFINPTVSLSNLENDDLYLLHYGGAVLKNGVIYIYFSGYDGSVKTIQYKLSADDKNGQWSDIFTAIPEDLSDFKIGNVVMNDSGRIFICGRFGRKEEYETDTYYYLLTWSDNGKDFSLDRKTLFTMVNLRWQVVFHGINTSFIDTNRVHTETSPYQVVGETCPNTVVVLNSISGDASGGWSADIKAGKEQYFDDVNVQEGYYAKLELGVYSGENEDGYDWQTYHDVVIGSVQLNIADGVRDHSLELVPDALWHTNSMSYPFYMEKSGKSYYFDPAIDMTNLSRASVGSGIRWPLMMDMFTEDTEDSRDTLSSHFALEDKFWSRETSTVCVEEPEFGAEETYEIRLYGWSRAGRPSTNPNTADNTSTATPNDVFVALLLVVDEAGNEFEIEAEPEDLASTYDHPPQTWFVAGVRAGSYPVVYNIPNPGEGYKIRKLGILVKGNTTGTTTFYVERVEMPGITALYSPMSDTYSWGDQKNTTAWSKVDEFSLQVDANNATNGNKVTSTYVTKIGYAYAIVVTGKVEFTRNSKRIIQDPNFVAFIDEATPGYISPTWDRKYPPGTGPTINPSVQIKSGTDWTGASSATVEDNIASGQQVNSVHQYIYHQDMSAIRASSTIDARNVPYVYGFDNELDVSLYLYDSGAISDIVDGDFTVQIFECPTPIWDFKFFKSVGTGERTFSVEKTFKDGSITPIPNQLRYKEVYTSTSGGEGLTKSGVSFRPDTDGIYRIKATLSIGKYADVYINSMYIEWPDSTSDTWDISGTGYFSQTKTKNFSLTHDVLYTCSLKWYYPAGDITTATRIIEIECLGTDEATQPQVFEPPSFILPGVSGTGPVGRMKNSKKGIPQILFAYRPYTAFNFEARARYDIQGPYSLAGILGLGSDKKNFVAGYFRGGELGICMMRDGKRTVLATYADATILGNKVYDIRFWHRDGLFGVEMKHTDESEWPTRGSMLLYEWEGDTNGPLCMADDVYHIGAYSSIEPPMFRTVGFRSSQGNVPLMPLDYDPDLLESNFYNNFPSSGSIDVGGYLYDYSGKTIFLENTCPYGPYIHMNLTDWETPYSFDAEDGHNFPGSRAIEFSKFNWAAAATHYNDYLGMVIAHGDGYNWLCDEAQEKVWITTSNVIVWLLNRTRLYGDDIPDDVAYVSGKIWITDGLTGLTPLFDPGGSEIHHSEGDFVFVHSDDSVTLYDFFAANGMPDQTVENLLENFSAISGTSVEFPGNTVHDTHSFGDGDELEL